jgi:hypothetical protein
MEFTVSTKPESGADNKMAAKAGFQARYYLVCMHNYITSVVLRRVAATLTVAGCAENAAN